MRSIGRRKCFLVIICIVVKTAKVLKNKEMDKKEGLEKVLKVKDIGTGTTSQP